MKRETDIIKIKENRKHGTVLVPFSLYECPMPELFTHVPTHWHEEFELNYIWEGRGEIYLNGEKYEVSKGDILVILPNALHAAYPGKGESLRYEAFVFAPSLLGMGSQDRCAVECVYPLVGGQINIDSYITEKDERYPQIRECVLKILAWGKENSAQGDLLLKSWLFRLVYLLEKDGAVNNRTAALDSGLIRPALRYMEEHFAQSMTIDQLARCCSLSKSYFMYCFKKTTGISAVEHLIRLRVRAACQALGRTGRSISEIAADCGYSNLSNFNRQFKKYVGCSPGSYRKMLKDSTAL